MKQIFLLFSFAFSLLLSGVSLADTTYIMTPMEIKHLPDADRNAYLGQIRSILAKGSESLLLAEKNECGETQRQCEASVFGENVCIPKHSAVSVACSQKMSRHAPYSINHWVNYYQRVQNFCGKQKKASAMCERLIETRVNLFMSRRTH